MENSQNSANEIPIYITGVHRLRNNDLISYYYTLAMGDGKNIDMPIANDEIKGYSPGMIVAIRKSLNAGAKVVLKDCEGEEGHMYTIERLEPGKAPTVKVLGKKREHPKEENPEIPESQDPNAEVPEEPKKKKILIIKKH